MTEITMPPVVERYMSAQSARDATALANCFALDGLVVDDGETFQGRPEIQRWQIEVHRRWNFTTTLVEAHRLDAAHCDAVVHLAGDFPGGAVDLSYRFTLRDREIESLTITA